MKSNGQRIRSSTASRERRASRKRRKGKGGGKVGAPATTKKVAKMTEAEMAAELKAWRTTKNVGLVCKAHAKGKQCNDANCTRAHPKQK